MNFIKNNRRIIIFSALILLFAVGAFVLNSGMSALRGDGINEAKQSSYERARVVRVVSDDTAADAVAKSGLSVGTQELEIELLTGSHKGEIVSVTNSVSLYYNVSLNAGDDFIAIVREDAANPDYGFHVEVSGHNRAPILLGVIGLFFLLLILIGGKKGLMSLLGLVFTVACVFSVFLPLIFRGVDPLLAAILVAVLTSFVTLTLTGGWNRKSATAIVGTVSGVVAAWFIASVTARLAHITLFNTEHAEALTVLSHKVPLSLNNILFAGVVIAALGAVMDVGMSVASAINEIHSANGSLDRKRLFKSGMNVGKDMIGTMSNTLILAFVGSSVNILILLYAYDLPFNQLLNLDMLAIEVLRAIAGSIGIILTIPITAYIAALLISNRKGGQA